MAETNANVPAAIKDMDVANCEKFVEKVVRGMGAPGSLEITEYHRQLAQRYFLSIDRMLKLAEEKRTIKNAANTNHKYDNPDPIGWGTIDFNALVMDVLPYARMGLDMSRPNHLHAIPYKNNSRTAPHTGTKMYTITLMKGYNGIRYTALKYAMEKPKAVTTELVYSTDVFRAIKKSGTNAVESYTFEVTNAFDRGEIIGGFGYIEYDDPVKNKLIIMSVKDILKRKPEKASGEFWGGKKTVSENGKKTEVDTDGWYEEMCLKTLVREVYSEKHLPIDPRKIDDDYKAMKMQELKIAQMEAAGTVEENAAVEYIDIEHEEVSEPDRAEQQPAKPPFLTDNGGQQSLDLGSFKAPEKEPVPAQEAAPEAAESSHQSGKPSWMTQGNKS